MCSRERVLWVQLVRSRCSATPQCKIIVTVSRKRRRFVSSHDEGMHLYGALSYLRSILCNHAGPSQGIMTSSIRLGMQASAPGLSLLTSLATSLAQRRSPKPRSCGKRRACGIACEMSLPSGGAKTWSQHCWAIIALATVLPPPYIQYHHHAWKHC